MSLRVACLLFTMAVYNGNCARIKVKAGIDDEGMDIGMAHTAEGTSHPVYILLTRHGLSCANIVANFVKGIYSKYHANMKDPLLCDAGVKFARDMKTEVQEALQTPQHNLGQPDAVLSSVLVRAIETALLQFEGSQVYIVPHIREHGIGYDNANNDRSTQIDKLKAKYSEDKWSVDYRYAETFGYKPEGNWNEFIHFLEDVFLPDFISRSGKQNGEPIVLAVTSHSNFMNTGTVYDSCKEYFPANPKTKKPKSNNNQVVKLSYEFSSHEAGGRDLTPEKKLTPIDGAGFCQGVVEGLSIFEGENIRDLCKSDIGEECSAQIRDEGGSNFPKTVEDILAEKTAKITKLTQQIESAPSSKASEYQAQITQLSGEFAELNAKQCWAGGSPALE